MSLTFTFILKIKNKEILYFNEVFVFFDESFETIVKTMNFSNEYIYRKRTKIFEDNRDTLTLLNL